MSDAQATFNTVITAKDQTGPAIAKLNGDVVKAAQRLGSLGGVTTTVFKGMKEGMHEFGHVLGHAREGINKLYEGIKSLASPMEALAGLGVVGGLFELTEHVAENFGALEHSAKIIGVTADQLQRLHFIANLTDTDTGNLDKALTRFATHMGGALHGTDKEAANMFKRLGIHLRDTHGVARSTADVFQDMFRVFELNKNPNTRDWIAQVLFGMRGVNVADMLGLQRDRLREFFGIFDEIHYSMSDTEKLNLEKFHEGWVTMKTAVAELGIAIGSKLSPILGDVVNAFTKWVAKNKEWVATDIADAVRQVVDYLRAVDWAALWGRVQEGTGKLFEVLEAIASGILKIRDAYEWVESHADAARLAQARADYAGREPGTVAMPPDFGEFAPMMIPLLPSFGLPFPMPDFSLSLPGERPSLRAPGLNPSGSWERGPWDTPLAPEVRGSIDININGAPAGTTVEVTREGGIRLRPRVNGSTGEAFGWP